MKHQQNAHTATLADLITAEGDATIKQIVKATDEIMDLHEAQKLTEDALDAWKDPLVMVSTVNMLAQTMHLVRQLIRNLDDIREEQQGLMLLLAAHGVLPVVDHEEHHRMIAADLH